MRRSVYKPLGFLFLGFAIIGVVLPILPTTPFLLLAAWFFARSSEKWHARLLASELFGPMIRNWEENRCITRRTKLVAMISMLVAGSFSILFAVEQTWLKLLGLGMVTMGATVVLRIKTCDLEENK
ncbi:MAG: YbaN family protein [Halieaceae bacterium]